MFIYLHSALPWLRTCFDICYLRVCNVSLDTFLSVTYTLSNYLIFLPTQYTVLEKSDQMIFKSISFSFSVISWCTLTLCCVVGLDTYTFITLQARNVCSGCGCMPLLSMLAETCFGTIVLFLGLQICFNILCFVDLCLLWEYVMLPLHFLVFPSSISISHFVPNDLLNPQTYA